MEADISSLIAAADDGNRTAQQALFSSLYGELMRLARRELARGGPAATIGAATLVHEAYLDIASRHGPTFPDKARFMAYAARVMRGIIIDHARRRCALKRGGAFEITAMKTDAAIPMIDDGELGRIGDALEELARIEPLLAQIVDLRFFCGFSIAEIAVLRDVSKRTVQRDWDKARIYLHDRIQFDPVT